MANKQMNKDDEHALNGGSEFPKHSLKAALRISLALEEKNSGNPMPPTDIAIALDKSPGSSDFRMLFRHRLSTVYRPEATTSRG